MEDLRKCINNDLAIIMEIQVSMSIFFLKKNCDNKIQKQKNLTMTIKN